MTAATKNRRSTDETQRDRLADLLRPIVEKIVDERLAELTAAELEQLRDRWQASSAVDR